MSGFLILLHIKVSTVLMKAKNLKLEIVSTVTFVRWSTILEKITTRIALILLTL